MNTRKWPRTTNEAFPGTYEYSCSIERPYESGFRKWTRAVVALCALGFITLLFRAAI